VLDEALKNQYRIDLTPALDRVEDQLQLGYFKLTSFK
jgi:hypothetical protein